MTFLNNWYRADARGTALTYASAVAVEEKSILDYNSGNPDGELSPGRVAAEAEGAARRHLPEGGDALLRQPLPRARRGLGDARAAAGRAALRGLRPAAREPGAGCWSTASGPATRPSPSATRSWPPTASTRTSRRTCSTCPSRPSSSKVLDTWEQQRKAARVLLVIDVSGLDGRPRQPGLRRHEAGAGPATPPSPPSTSSRTPTRSGLRIFTTDLDASGADLGRPGPRGADGRGPADAGSRTRSSR